MNGGTNGNASNLQALRDNFSQLDLSEASRNELYRQQLQKQQQQQRQHGEGAPSAMAQGSSSNSSSKSNQVSNQSADQERHRGRSHLNYTQPSRDDGYSQSVGLGDVADGIGGIGGAGGAGGAGVAGRRPTAAEAAELLRRRYGHSHIHSYKVTALTLQNYSYGLDLISTELHTVTC